MLDCKIKKYFSEIDALFQKYKGSNYYNQLNFTTVHADAHYSLDEDGNALFNFVLTLKKREGNGEVNEEKIFYIAVPIIESFNGKCIENGNRCQNVIPLLVKFPPNSKVVLGPQKPKVIKTSIRTNASLNDPVRFRLDLIQIGFKPSNDEDVLLEVSFQVKNFAIDNFSRVRWLVGRKKFNILWYFGFLTTPKTNYDRTAKIEIEHPNRGHLEIEEIEDRIRKTEHVIGFSKHGRKFICGLHANHDRGNPPSLHTFFDYSYMPEWAVLLLSIIIYNFILGLYTIFYSKNNKIISNISSLSEIPKKFTKLFYPSYLWDWIVFLILTFIIYLALRQFLNKNCS